MRLFKLDSYHPDDERGVVMPARPVFISADTYSTAHAFACSTLSVYDPKGVKLSPFAGRLPENAIVIHPEMTFDEIWVDIELWKEVS